MRFLDCSELLEVLPEVLDGQVLGDLPNEDLARRSDTKHHSELIS